MQVIHYPDDPRPARWHQPVLALGNFDGMHRGHLKIIERVRRGAEERGATAVAMTFDPHPSKIVRPDKAPPLLMTQSAEARRAGARRHARRGDRPVHAGAGAVGSGDVRAHGARRVAARRRGLGRRELSVRPRSGGHFLDAAQPRRALRLSRREDRSGPLQGLRRQQHAHSAADHRRARRRGRRAARALTTRSTARSCRGSSGDGSSAFRRRTSAPTTSWSRRTASMRRRPIVEGVAYPSITNIGTRPTFESGEETVIETHLLDFDKDLYGAGCGWDSCSGCATKRSSTASTR